MNLILSEFASSPLHRTSLATGGIALGIACAAAYQIPAYSLIACSLICFPLILWGTKNRTLLACLIIGSFLLGNSLYTRQHHTFDTIAQQLTNGLQDIQATIASMDSIDNPRFSHKITLKLSAHRKSESEPWSPCPGNIILYAQRKNAQLQVDDTIELTRVHINPAKSKEFRLYAIKEGFIGTFFCMRFDPTIIHTPIYSISRWAHTLKHDIYQALRNTMNTQTFNLLSSIYLGNNNIQKKSLGTIRDIFKEWGISHYLARSGLHLIIFIMLWQFLIFMLPLPYRSKKMIVALLLLVYTSLSWISISFTRALLMFFIYTASIARLAPCNYIHCIALTSLAVLLYNPSQLFFIDFQLSFGLTLALAWFNAIEGSKKQQLETKC